MRRPLKGPFQPNPFCDSKQKSHGGLGKHQNAATAPTAASPPNQPRARSCCLHISVASSIISVPAWEKLPSRPFHPVLSFFLPPLHTHDSFLQAQSSRLLRREQHPFLPSGGHDTDSLPSLKAKTPPKIQFEEPCAPSGDTHPLLLLLRADVAADVGPRNVLGPPDGLAALLAPAWLPTTRGILQHLGDEGSQLCLERAGG